MALNHKSPQFLQQRLFYQGRKFGFAVERVRLPNQVEGEYEWIRHPGGALAVPVTPEGQLVLVYQYRFAVSGWLVEFPAGTVEPQEGPEATIKREIEEEIGYRASCWQYLGQFALAPAYSDEHIRAFLAQGLVQLQVPPKRDPDEEMETILMAPQEFERAAREGAVDAKSLASYFLARPFLGLD